MNKIMMFPGIPNFATLYKICMAWNRSQTMVGHVWSLEETAFQPLVDRSNIDQKTRRKPGHNIAIYLNDTLIINQNEDAMVMCWKRDPPAHVGFAERHFRQEKAF